MTFLKKALSPFVDFSDQDVAQAVEVGRAVMRGPVSIPLPAQLSSADVEKFAAHFEELFEKSNFPGPDYYEFSKAVEALEPHIPAEAARMQAAFTSLGVQGMTKERVLETAKQYIAIVEADRAEIEKAAAEKTKDEIAPLEQNVRMAESQVSEDEMKIKLLQDGLAAKRLYVEQTRTSLTNAKERLGTNIEGYQAASALMVQRIQADITKITNTL